MHAIRQDEGLQLRILGRIRMGAVDDDHPRKACLGQCPLDDGDTHRIVIRPPIAAPEDDMAVGMFPWSARWPSVPES